MHKFVLHNGRIYEAGERLLAPGQVGLLNGWGVFSTIRVFEGVLFAFERHWERMKRDATLLRTPMPGDAEEVRANLHRLVEANEAFDATLRVAVVRNRGGIWEGPGIERACDVIAFTAVLPVWGESARLAVQPQARHAACDFAGTKILSWAYNLAWLESARARGFDEVVLLNERGEVSECTSANIFAAFGAEVFTPPLSSGCLPGITREILLEEGRAGGHAIAERSLELDDLYRADSVFITSTTRELLAVAAIEGRAPGGRQEARLALQAAFARKVDDYVAAARSAGRCARMRSRDKV